MILTVVEGKIRGLNKREREAHLWTISYLGRWLTRRHVPLAQKKPTSP
jgi:hypothetical protein